jgi:hypothetical protein
MLRSVCVALPALLAALAGPLTAQAEARGAAATSRSTTEPGTPSLAKLTELVRQAHGGGEKHRPVDSFRAEIDMTKLDGDSVQVSLGVRFLHKDFLRYEVKEGDTRKERGIDEDGEWAVLGRQVFDLGEGRNETERDLVRQHLAICQQLARFVDPAELLSSLLQKDEPRTATIDLAEDEVAVACHRVLGYSNNFPLFHRPPGSAKATSVRVELYFDAQKHRLRAIGAQPLDAVAKPIGTGEWITLNDIKDAKGYLLPRSIVVWEPGPRPKRLAKIKVGGILWNPPLVAADFARPKR